MARIARIVIPQVAHHVTQRGNRRLPVFFSDDDRREYLALLAEHGRAAGTRCLAWCLMDNHVHLLLVPESEDGLRAMLGEAHRRYTRAINRREGWQGHLFQARFASYPMDEAHQMIAARYVERNPVAAGLVADAADWRWSSARSHLAGARTADDPLTEVEALARHVPDWRAFLRDGVEAAGAHQTDEEAAKAIESRLATGRPFAADRWIARQEATLDRPLAPRKRGRKPKTDDET